MCRKNAVNKRKGGQSTQSNPYGDMLLFCWYRKGFLWQQMWHVIINVSFRFVWIIQWGQQSILSPCSAVEGADSTLYEPRLQPVSPHFEVAHWGFTGSTEIHWWQTHTVQMSKPDRFYPDKLFCIPSRSFLFFSFLSFWSNLSCMGESKSSWCTREINLKNLWLVFSFNSGSRAYPSKH